MFVASHPTAASLIRDQGIGKIMGRLVKDTISVRSLSIKDQSFIAADTISENFDQVPPAGLIGIAFFFELDMLLTSSRDGIRNNLSQRFSNLVRKSYAQPDGRRAVVRGILDIVGWNGIRGLYWLCGWYQIPWTHHVGASHPSKLLDGGNEWDSGQ
jgi:hypothetical protein